MMGPADIGVQCGLHRHLRVASWVRLTELEFHRVRVIMGRVRAASGRYCMTVDLSSSLTLVSMWSDSDHHKTLEPLYNNLTKYSVSGK